MKTTKKIALIFVIISLIKIILSNFVPSPSIFADEYLYLKMAQSFSENFNFIIHSLPSDTYPPLYPIIISISFLFNDVSIAYIVIKIINSLLSTLIIIPAYLISKEFLDEKKSLFAATLISILPIATSFSPYIMSENLFYPLFLTSIYFIYKSFTNKSYKYDVLTGISIGLSLLTKLTAISLIFILLIFTLYNIISKKAYNQIKRKILVCLLAFIIFLPWLIRNGILFGFTKSGLMGNYSNLIQNINISYHSFIIWIFLYIGFLLLSSLFIFLPLNFVALKEKLRDEKLRTFVLITFIAISVILISVSEYAAKSNIKEKTWVPDLTGRPIGRYIDLITPLIVLHGVITYYKYKKEAKKQISKILIFFIPITILSSQLMFFPLLPLNNISLTEIGVFNSIIEKIASVNISVILITILMMFIIFLISYLNKINKLLNKKMLKIAILIFVLINLLNFGVIYYNSKTFWYNNPQEQLSLWIKDNIQKDKTILIDHDDCGNFNKEKINILCTNKKSTQLTALWIRNKVIVDSISETENINYIITTKKLNLELIKETENDIYLYKVS